MSPIPGLDWHAIAVLGGLAAAKAARAGDPLGWVEALSRAVRPDDATGWFELLASAVFALACGLFAAAVGAARCGAAPRVEELD